MTGLLSEQTFSRTSFLKGGGALVVGFSMAGAVAGTAAAAGPTVAGYSPDLTQVDSFLVVHPDNTVDILWGQPEWGHGAWTGISQMVAEEMGLDMSQVNYLRPDTWINGNGGGGGSSGLTTRALPVRAAAAAAYNALLGLASTRLGVPTSQLSVAKGVVSGGGKTVTYGQLIGGQRFNVQMPATAQSLQMGQAPAKPVSSYTLAGTFVPRIDIPAKVAATYVYIHNVRVPGMVHARVVRPHGQGGVTTTDAFPVTVDPSSVAHIPGVKIVQIGNFLAVTAPHEYDAIQAAAELKVTYKNDPLLPGSGDFWSWLRQAGDTNTTNPARFTTLVGNVPAALASSAKTLSATYHYQYNGHMSIGPTCAIADVQSDHITIFCNSQQPSSVSTVLAGFQMNGQPYFGLPAAQIRAIFYEGSSSYGSQLSTGPATDVHIAAAVISKAVGAPVRLQWMRWDEHGWDAYGPAAMYDVTAGIDGAGNITALDWTSYGQGGTSISPTSEQIGFQTWPTTPANGGPNTSDTIYRVATVNKRVLAKTQPLYGGALRSAALRAPGAQQSHFAGEQLIDELAHLANMDPLAFRVQNIDATTSVGSRWVAALQAAATLSSWQPKVANSIKQTGSIRTGRGFAFGTFGNTQVAMVADINVNMNSGKIVAKHLYVAHNNAITVGPDLIANQAEGAAIMGLSRAFEGLTFTKERVTSTDWVTYPILRFKDAPKVTVGIVAPGGGVLVNVPGAGVNTQAANTAAFNAGWTPTGAGEPAAVPPAAAVANAFFDATGVRIREAPMTAQRVRATLKAAGVI